MPTSAQTESAAACCLRSVQLRPACKFHMSGVVISFCCVLRSEAYATAQQVHCDCSTNSLFPGAGAGAGAADAIACRTWLIIDIVSCLPLECMISAGGVTYNYNLGHLNRCVGAPKFSTKHVLSGINTGLTDDICKTSCAVLGRLNSTRRAV